MMKLAWHPWRRKPSKQVALVEANIFELDPAKKYVIGLDRAWLTPDERIALSKILVNKGIQNITVVAGNGDPADSMVVLEQKG